MKGSIVGYFVVSLISGIAIGVGLILLVLPALILMTRWLPAFGILLATDTPTDEALGKAWDITNQVFWPLFLALLTPTVIILVPTVLMWSSDSQWLWRDDPSSEFLHYTLLGSLALNGLSSAFALMISALGIASFSLLRDGSASLSEVFE